MPRAKEHADPLYLLQADADKGLKQREITRKATNRGFEAKS